MAHMLSKATVEALWGDFDVPVNGLGEIDDGFCGWERLTDRDEIWRWFDGQYARWGGVHALMFPGGRPEAGGRPGLEQRMVATFEPEDVTARLEADYPELLAFVVGNGLMDAVVMGAAARLRDWYDDASGDAAWECMTDALRWAVGDEELRGFGYEV